MAARGTQILIKSQWRHVHRYKEKIVQLPRFSKIENLISLFFIFSYAGLCSVQWLIFGEDTSAKEAQEQDYKFQEVSKYSFIFFITMFFVCLFSSFGASQHQLLCNIYSTSIALILSASTFLKGFTNIPMNLEQIGKYHVIVHMDWVEWIICIPFMFLVLSTIAGSNSKFSFVLVFTNLLSIISGYFAHIFEVVLGKLICIFMTGISSLTLLYFLFLTCNICRPNLRIPLDLGLSFLFVWASYLYALFIAIQGTFSPQSSCRQRVLLLDVLSKICFLAAFHHYNSKKHQQSHAQNEMNSKILNFVRSMILTPFQSVLLELDKMEKEEQIFRYQPLIAMLKKSGMSMQVIEIEDELSKFKPEIMLANKPFDITRIIGSVLQSFAQEAQKKRIALQHQISKHIPSIVIGDDTKIELIFESLISNAIKFSPPNTAVYVWLHIVDFLEPNLCRLSFTVQDSGPGIPENIVPVLLTAFPSYDESLFCSREDRTTYLSLYNTNRLADLMGATVHFTNSVDRGAIFRITFILECFSKSQGGFNNFDVSHIEKSAKAISNAKFDPKSHLYQTKSTIGCSIDLEDVQTYSNRVSAKILPLDERERGNNEIALYTCPLETTDQKESEYEDMCTAPNGINTPFEKSILSCVEDEKYEVSTSCQEFGQFYESLENYNETPAVSLSERRRVQSKTSAVQNDNRCGHLEQSIGNKEPTNHNATSHPHLGQHFPNMKLPMAHSTANVVGSNSPKTNLKVWGAEILIVDDVDSNKKLAEIILTKAGYSCDLARNGLEAVQMVRENHYKLVIMDKMMPVMDGIEATRQIIAFNPDISVVGLTGATSPEDLEAFLHSGAKDVLQKPAERVQLIKICEAYVD